MAAAPDNDAVQKWMSRKATLYILFFASSGGFVGWGSNKLSSDALAKDIRELQTSSAEIHKSITTINLNLALLKAEFDHVRQSSMTPSEVESIILKMVKKESLKQ